VVCGGIPDDVSAGSQRFTVVYDVKDHYFTNSVKPKEQQDSLKPEEVPVTFNTTPSTADVTVKLRGGKDGKFCAITNDTAAKLKCDQTENMAEQFKMVLVPNDIAIGNSNINKMTLARASNASLARLELARPYGVSFAYGTAIEAAEFEVKVELWKTTPPSKPAHDELGTWPVNEYFYRPGTFFGRTRTWGPDAQEDKDAIPTGEDFKLKSGEYGITEADNRTGTTKGLSHWGRKIKRGTLDWVPKRVYQKNGVYQKKDGAFYDPKLSQMVWVQYSSANDAVLAGKSFGIMDYKDSRLNVIKDLIEFAPRRPRSMSDTATARCVSVDSGEDQCRYTPGLNYGPLSGLLPEVELVLYQNVRGAPVPLTCGQVKRFKDEELKREAAKREAAKREARSGEARSGDRSPSEEEI
jgi:hypothetical protein